ncbi:MAG: hypothetical protein JWO38_7437 [Gemmataceae bacterium]|nr:hypothetical protein [Gemmataceae bacterium]
MTDLSIPLPILYAGLGGTLLALIVATAQNQWSCRVFFLLALRLAIGWQFLFEGMHKIHSHMVGPTETNRVFSSEPYFKVAPGPVGGFMRRQFADPESVIAAKVNPTKEYTPEAFAKLKAEDQAAACPEAVARDLDAMEEKTEAAIKAEAEAELKAADTTEEKGRKDAKTDADKAKVKETAEKNRQAARKKMDSFKEAAPALITASKAKYARWVYGVDGRDTKVKYMTGDASLTAPQRLAHLEWLRGEVKAEEDRQAAGLGNGNGIDQKKAAELRTDLVTAESDLARDADAFVAELKKDLNGGKAVEVPTESSRGQLMDKVTMWFLVGVGGCLMAGLLTRVMCVLGAGFLVMTYLAHPPFPWYPPPPNTEGNPLFVNKNAIECLALLALACMPTGRWLGLDALLMRVCCRRKTEAAA